MVDPAVRGGVLRRVVNAAATAVLAVDLVLLPLSTNLAVAALPPTLTTQRVPILLVMGMLGVVSIGWKLRVRGGEEGASRALDAAYHDLSAAVQADLRGQLVPDSRDDIALRWETVAECSADAWQPRGQVDELPRLLAARRRRGFPLQLVLLGQEGSGKSITAVNVALNLLRYRSAGEPVPVVFSMSGWDGKSEIQNWVAGRIADELLDASQYGKDTIRRLVDDSLVLPILDSFDELPEPVLADGLRAVNFAFKDAAPLVVVCRSEVFRRVSRQEERLAGRPPVVELQAVKPNDAIRYLVGGTEDERRRWLPIVERLRRRPDDAVARVLSSPLMLSLASRAYRLAGTDPERLGTLRGPDTR